MSFIFLNFLFYQIIWLVSIYGATNSPSYFGPLSALIFLIIHFIFIKDRFYQFKVMIALTFVGVMIEWLIHKQFVYSFVDFDFYLIPYWLIGIWLCFSCTLMYSLRLILKNKWVSLIGGSIFGPLSYHAAYEMGAIQITHPIFSYLILAITWGFGLLCIHFILFKKTN